MVFTLLGVALIAGAAGTYLSQRGRENAILKEQRTREILDLESRFQVEMTRLQMQLRDRPAILPAEMGLTETTSISHLKRFILDETGKVVGHANASEVGTRLDALAERIRTARTNRLEGKSWEGYPTTIRFERVPAWNAFYVLERAHVPVRADLGVEPIRAGFLLFALVLGIGLFAGGLRAPSGAGADAEIPIDSRSANSRGSPTVSAVPTDRLVTAPVTAPTHPPVGAPVVSRPLIPARPPVFDLPRGEPAKLRPPTAKASELGPFLFGRRDRAQALREERSVRERQALDAFDRETRSTRGNASAFEAKLVESVARATKGPAIFFRYDSRQGIASLSAEAGHPLARDLLAQGAAGMSFAVGAALVAEIHAREKKGMKKPLWDHAPLSRLLLSRLNISRFEAWPMIRARGWDEGPARLDGILVVVQDGIGRDTHRGFLGTLLDRASRHSDV
jgi:hypothetical protein